MEEVTRVTTKDDVRKNEGKVKEKDKECSNANSAWHDAQLE